MDTRGTKIFDPKLQSQALLTKLVIRNLQPGFEPWNAFV